MSLGLDDERLDEVGRVRVGANIDGKVGAVAQRVDADHVIAGERRAAGIAVAWNRRIGRQRVGRRRDRRDRRGPCVLGAGVSVVSATEAGDRHDIIDRDRRARERERGHWQLVDECDQADVVRVGLGVVARVRDRDVRLDRDGRRIEVPAGQHDQTIDGVGDAVRRGDHDMR